MNALPKMPHISMIRGIARVSTVPDPCGSEYPEMNIALHGISRREADGILVPRPMRIGEDPIMTWRHSKRPSPESSSGNLGDGASSWVEKDEVSSTDSGDEGEIGETDTSSSVRNQIRRGALYRNLIRGDVASFVETSKAKYTRKKGDSYRRLLCPFRRFRRMDRIRGHIEYCHDATSNAGASSSRILRLAMAL